MKEKLPPKSWVLDLAQSIEDSVLRTLVVMAYLTAGRITELLELKKGDLIFKTEKERPILIVSMSNRKNKKRHFKDIPIALDSEADLVRIINDYIKQLDMNDMLFPLSKYTVWHKLRKYGINPHYLRHVRLSHLVLYHDFNEQLLIQFAGWSDSRPARNYMHLRYTDMLDKL